MDKVQLASSNFRKWLPLIYLALPSLTLAVIMRIWDRDIYRRFLGNIEPLLVFCFALLILFTLLPYLQRKSGLRIFDGRKKGYLAAIAAALIFGAIVIPVDMLRPFPADTNAPFPISLVFYPVFAILAEAGFHVIPLTLFFFILQLIFPRQKDKALLAAIILTAVSEPTFHAVMMLVQPGNDLVLTVFVWFHVFMFTLVQLLLYRKYDFYALLTLRLVYYLIWHIAWGHWRLGLVQ